MPFMFSNKVLINVKEAGIWGRASQKQSDKLSKHGRGASGKCLLYFNICFCSHFLRRIVMKTNLMTQINTKNISVMGTMAMLSLFLTNRHSEWQTMVIQCYTYIYVKMTYLFWPVLIKIQIRTYDHTTFFIIFTSDVFKLFWKEMLLVLHHGKHAPIPTILRPVAGIKFEMSSFWEYNFQISELKKLLCYICPIVNKILTCDSCDLKFF